MSKKRISKASKKRLSIFGIPCVICILYFIFCVCYNVYTIYDLTIEKNKLEKKYVQLQEEAEQLKIDINKLNDPQYLANYARENYLYSKNGEYIIQLGEAAEEANDTISALNITINKKYIEIALCVVMVLIFIYILSKGKKKNKKK